MQFKQKIEAATRPLIEELRRKLALLPTVAVLNHYQMKHHASQFSAAEFPDGFWAKWRYVWALLLSNKFIETENPRDAEEEGTRIDDLVEKIFDLYSFGAIYEPGRELGSEKEFLARLGLGLRVREPDTLGFPEQIKTWAVARFQPFDVTYFVPNFGLKFNEIFAWIDGLTHKTERRLNDWIAEMVPIAKDTKSIQSEVKSGRLNLSEAQDKAKELRIAERLEGNGRHGDLIHILSESEMEEGIPQKSLDALLAHFCITPGEVNPEFVFPHDPNPLEHKLFVRLPERNFYFLDPASAHRILAKTFEKDVCGMASFRERYLATRSRALEDLVAASVRSPFPTSEIYRNYYLERGTHEKDILIRENDTVILIECKHSRIRPFGGTTDDLIKFESDFDNSVQYGYEQAYEVKCRLLENEETTFFDSKGNPKFSIKKAEIRNIYILCITPTPRGPFGTDLSYELEKVKGEPFPLAMGLFDFQTICKYFNGHQFLQYLRQREPLHGLVRTGDELNYAGYFLRFGNLDLGEIAFLNDDFSKIFDRKWYREQGFDVEEPTGEPILTSMKREGNRLHIEHGSGQQEVIPLPDWVVDRAFAGAPTKMKGSERNKPCPCGSGLKMKHCCGIN